MKSRRRLSPKHDFFDKSDKSVNLTVTDLSVARWKVTNATF